MSEKLEQRFRNYTPPKYAVDAKTDLPVGLPFDDHFTTDWPSVYYKPEELACPDTGLLVVDLQSLRMLELACEILGYKLPLTSAFRTTVSNKRVGGAKRSRHLFGKGFDVNMIGQTVPMVYEALKAAGFKGFIHKPKNGFLHTDNRAVWYETGDKSWVDYQKSFRRGLAPTPPQRPENLLEDGDFKKVGAAIAGGGAVVTPLISSLGDLALVPQIIAIGGLIAFAGFGLWFVIDKVRK